jgi:hypothetical protein
METCAVIEKLFNVLYPLSSLDKSKYVILDRHRITSLSDFDKWHCIMCGYVVGYSRFHQDSLRDHEPNALQWVYGLAVLTLIVPLFILGWFFSLWISIFSGYPIALAWHFPIENKLRKGPFALLEVGFKCLSDHLTYIESTWCAVKHINNRGDQLPEIHEFYYDRHDINKWVLSIEEDPRRYPHLVGCVGCSKECSTTPADNSP